MIFSGTVKSDYEKLVEVPDAKKPDFIDFGAIDFLTSRNRFLDYIKAVYPDDYNAFVESDLGMMIAELFAYLGTTTTYKGEFLANERILATVQRRDNLADLLELIGVRLLGPTAAVGDAILTFDTTPDNFDRGAFDPIPVKLEAKDRTVTITSPEDGAPVTYTLYKVNVAGTLDNVTNGKGELELNGYEAELSNNTTSTVFTNLALLEGAFALASGTFGAAENIKSVTLPKSPVIEGSVEVFVETDSAVASGFYRQVRNIYFASGPGERVFQVVNGDDFTSKVVFGDGVAGVSPPNGSNYTVTYRVGGGARGNLDAEVINVRKEWRDGNNGQTGINGILENLSKITGGAPAESVAHAKKWAPLNFRRQDRCVTLADYTVFANSFQGSVGTVAKARAVTRDAFSSGNMIDVYTLERASDTQLKRATPQFKVELLGAYDGVKMATDEVTIVDGLIRTLDLNLTIFVDESNRAREEVIKQAVRVKVQDFFNPDNFDFGKEFVVADLLRQVYTIDGVRFSEATNIDDNIRVDFNEIIQLNNLALTVNYV